METEELCSVNISPLVTSPFAIQWSPDNQISIITEKGIHILQLEPSPMSPNPAFEFVRSFIYTSETFPACAFTDEMDSSIWNSMRRNVCSLLVNDVTPKLDGATDKFLRVAKAAWSPKNLISPSQCVLAILNSAGAVELLHKVSNNWYSICDVSSLRLKMLRNENIETNLDKRNFPKKSNNQSVRITEGIQKLQACSMTWSELFGIGETSFAYFSVAYCSGDVLIWKVPKISNFIKSLELVFLGTIDLNDSSLIANVLCWIAINVNEHLIVIGYLDGRIRSVKLTDRNDNLRIASVENYVDSDCVAVNYLHRIQDKSDIKILAAKDSLLLLLCVNSAGELKSIRHLCVQGFAITGVIPIVAQQFLITAQNNHTFIVDTQSNDLVNVNIKCHLPQTRVRYLGLAYSPNKVIFASVTSPNTVYDHLVTREPSVMHIFTLRGAICDALSIIDNSASLGSVWDCMEVLRLKAAKANDPCVILYPIPRKLEPLSLYKLQISMWLSVIMNVCTTKKPMPSMDHVRESKITEALPLIFLHSACAYLENSIERNALSEDQMSAVFLLRRYLEIYQGVDETARNEDVDRRIREILNTTTFYPNQVERCNLCSEIIDGMWQVRSCPRGHKLSRCCMTLLQITLLEYRTCPICGQIFHPCLEDMYEEPRCQFCDVPILRNLYDFDTADSELYGRNLSLSRIADNAESLRDPELEKPSDKQKRSKWDTSHTYSVIVNNDGDESGRITEKWEEF